MDEKEDTKTQDGSPLQAKVTPSSVMVHHYVPVPPPLTDVDAFMQLLPTIVGSYALKHDNAQTIRDLAIKLARETALGLVHIGVAIRTTPSLDAQPLAAPGAVIASPQPAPLGNNNGHGLQGAMVAHYQSSEVQKVHGL